MIASAIIQRDDSISLHKAGYEFLPTILPVVTATRDRARDKPSSLPGSLYFLRFDLLLLFLSFQRLEHTKGKQYLSPGAGRPAAGGPNFFLKVFFLFFFMQTRNSRGTTSRSSEPRLDPPPKHQLKLQTT